MGHPDPIVVAAGARELGLDAFEPGDSVWNRAVGRAAQADPFCCRSEWQLAFHETHYPDRPLHLLRLGRSLVALAAHRLPGRGLRLEPLECHWSFGCPLLGSRAVELLRALTDAVSRAEGEAPELLISGLLPGSALLREVVLAFHGRAAIYRCEPGVSRSASLEGGIDGYLSRRSAKHRRNLRQSERRARARGVCFERVVPRDAAAAAATYERMLDVERASWKGIGECGMAESPSREFYAALLVRMARSGIGRVVFARRDDRDVGFVFGGLAGTTYRGQQFSFVEDERAASIGNLLQLEQLRWLCEEGATRYDMGPRMDYKLHWTEVETVAEALLIRP
ncbi:MAG: GNAT family N-acetyltransferase [Planctomycetes bacterium]|nr:GNAT family N-acetyltransferase [Planctomycetota bacterium]MCB9887794.1 GNAT family N-acetyltransferase [Planctomycetota bacterium]